MRIAQILIYLAEANAAAPAAVFKYHQGIDLVAIADRLAAGLRVVFAAGAALVFYRTCGWFRKYAAVGGAVSYLTVL